MTVETSTWATKKGLAQMLKGGVIMDVVTPSRPRSPRTPAPSP
jgi:pyridoxal 5'-phosphate synthase pdxS subunit